MPRDHFNAVLQKLERMRQKCKHEGKLKTSEDYVAAVMNVLKHMPLSVSAVMVGRIPPPFPLPFPLPSVFPRTPWPSSLSSSTDFQTRLPPVPITLV